MLRLLRAPFGRAIIAVALVAAVSVAGGLRALAQSIFDEAPAPLVPFTTKFFGENCGATPVIPCTIDPGDASSFKPGGPGSFNPGGPNSQVFSHAVSANGVVVGGNGVFTEGSSQEAVVWQPNFAAGTPQNGLVTILGRPAFPEIIGLDEYVGVATGISAGGTTIVGTSIANPVSGNPANRLYVPVIWRFNGAVWSNPERLNLLPVPVPVPTSRPGGGAYGISDNGMFATGWSGEWPNGMMQAVRWNLTAGGPGGLVQSLGNTPDGSPASAGNSVSNGGLVVGWYGLYYAFPGDLIFGTDSLGFTDLTAWQPKPFVWNGGPNMLALNRLGFTWGEAREINTSGNAAVGWVGLANPFFNVYEAVRWTTTDNWATHTALVLANIVSPAGDLRIGSVANAVDASGRVIVGRAEFDCTFGNCNHAAIWEVNSAGTASTGRTVAAALASVGINTGNYTLYDATGIRVVRNANGIATDIIVIGNGTRNATGINDIWLARLGRTIVPVPDPDPPPPDPIPVEPPPPPPGITTVPEQVNSLRSLGVFANPAYSDSRLNAFAQVGEHYRCVRPRGVEAYEHWCAFTFGIGSYTRSNAQPFGGSESRELSGIVGIARYFTPATSIGVSVGGTWFAGETSFAGRYEGIAPSIGAYFSHRPDQGWQVFLAAIATWITDLDVTRGYPNGIVNTSSSGRTDGFTGGAMGRFGYSFVVGHGLTLTPYVQISYAASRVNGWTETGGPFPAIIDGFNADTTTLRTGFAGRQIVSDRWTVFGSLACAHLLSSKTANVIGSLLVADCNGVAPLLAFCGLGGPGAEQVRDWGEVNGGLRVELSPVSVATMSLTQAFGPQNYFGTIGQVGYSRAF